MSLTSGFLLHLIELRQRLLKMVLGFVFVLICLLPFANNIYHWLATPLLVNLPSSAHMIATEITTPFFVPMKAAMLLAVIISSPFMLYQTWAFIAPGLYQHEKRFVLPLIVASFILFLLGMLFAYQIVLPLVFAFFTHTAPEGVVVMTDISHYLDFVISMLIAFGLAFEVPVLVVILVRAGIVKVQTLIEVRSYVIVGAFVIGAIFTPPDVLSQFLLAVPLCLLYELGVLFSKYFISSLNINRIDNADS
jgi:sec-independent protein translocase protein TatC